MLIIKIFSKAHFQWLTVLLYALYKGKGGRERDVNKEPQNRHACVEQ